MTGIVTVLCLALVLMVVAVMALRYRADRTVDTGEIILAGVLELAVLVYIGVRAADLIGGHRTSSTALAVSYLIGLALIMPTAALVGLFERSRWGPVIIAAGALVVAVLLARVHQLWTPGA